MKPFTQPSRGQDAVEFALIVPILILVVIVTLDMGRAVYSTSILINAAREGARYGVIHPTDPIGIEDVVESMAVGIDPGLLTVTSDQPDEHTIHVRAEYAFSAVTPLVGTLLGSNTITLIGEASMQVEH